MKSTLKLENISIRECLKSLGMTEATANIFVLPKVIRKPISKP
ncbi:hypothetical protein [Leadbetterella byssophila]|nr:hypothetical protein [Leadbetterella byssophila]